MPRPLPSAGANQLSIGEFRVDLVTGEVHGPDDTVGRLQPKPLQVLQVLASRPGELITREELHRLAWGKTEVTDNSLARCIKLIRKEFNDDRLTAHCIADNALHRTFSDDKRKSVYQRSSLVLVRGVFLRSSPGERRRTPTHFELGNSL